MSFLVFINPSEIEFNADGEAQTISIYNPYEFPIAFSFKSTRPNAFTLSATQGEILSKHSLDILIDLIDKSVVEEKFLIKIYPSGKEKKLGEKIIRVTYKPEPSTDCTTTNSSSNKRNVPSNQKSPDFFHDLDHKSFYADAKSSEHKRKPTAYSTNQIPNQFLIYIALLVCLAILMLPHEENAESNLNYFQVSVNFKLVAAYVLGIVTVFLIRN